MKLANSRPLGPLALLVSLSVGGLWAFPAWADSGDALFGNAGTTANDGFDPFGTGAVGNMDANGQAIGNLGNPGVLGESHPGWMANQVNSGTNIPGQISDYPNWSSTIGDRSGGNGPNQRHQFPIGVRGGLPATTTQLQAPLTKVLQQPIPDSGFDGGPHNFGFGGQADNDTQYEGVTATYKGVALPGSGGTLPHTSTGSCGINVTDGY